MRTQTQSLMPALGDEYRTAREARGLSLSDVAEQIHIRSVYLAQIEKENWPAIGAPVYVRGFLRTYARFLGVDAEKAVAQFNESLAAGGSSSSGSSSGPPAGAVPTLRRSGFSPILWVAGTIAAILVAFVIYNSYTLSRGHRTAAANRPAASGTVAPSSAYRQRTHPRAAAAPSRTLWVRFTAPSWVRVTIDGNVSMEGTFPSGTLKKFHGKRAGVRVGNAGGVDITVNSKHVGKLGAIGNVADRTFALQE
ncbi:MAG: DUF4115 domain-containing protein [Candidatus Eremiobacteraeota bacterium]|nr:DUF4115 domain-containing protein [Candidatus Eremiobacteraeota bacterium]